MNKIELLMPCGDKQRLKAALLYGADAVFAGGKKFSLRAKASNFTLSDIAESAAFAHSLGKKIYITVNIIPHYSDLKELEQYLLDLDKCNIDAIIVSSLAIISLCKKLKVRFACHVSTQVSASNETYLSFYERLGCSRVVLARECTLDDIKNIHASSPLELEVFIQGGLCSSISGKCTLSNYFVNRDANRGGCAHSCRWDYTLYDENGNQIEGSYPFKIASKDLMGIRKVPDLVNLGVSSLKVEGRMKSINYIAIVSKTYRNIIDKCYSGNLSEKDMLEAENTLKMIESRPLTEAYLSSNGVDSSSLIYLNESLMVNQKYLGVVSSYSETTHIAKINRKNDISLHQKITVFAYDQETYEDEIISLSDDNGPLVKANKTEFDVYIKTNKPLKPYYIIRANENNNS